MTREELCEVCKRMNGYKEDGPTKVTMSYQCYVADENHDPDKEPVHTTEKPALKLSLDPKNPDWYVVDVMFRSYHEPELKLFWGYLQFFRENQNKYPDKDSIFYLNILENESVENDRLLAVNLINPFLFYLTADVPNADGLNIIRMLVHADSLQVTEARNEYLSEEIGNMMRQMEEERYLNEQTDTSVLDGAF